jgi:hypothetical protein
MKSKPKFVKTQTALAKACGVSRQAITYHVGRAGSPEKVKGKFPVEQWQEYLLLIGKNKIPPELKARQIQLQNERLELANKKTRDELLPKNDVLLAISQAVAQAKRILESGPPGLAPQVVGVSIIEAEQILRAWIHQALTALSQDPLGKNQTEEKQQP